MAKSAAVAIGVDKIGGGMVPLQAAASGAQQFATWATARGYEVTEVTDGAGPVTLNDVIQAITPYCDGTYAQLLIYFAGHGILQSQQSEIWLLSQAPDWPNEAINVASSIELARRAPVQQVVLISDACRSASTGAFRNVTGGVIFPNSPRKPKAKVDRFYATLPGDPSVELPPDQTVGTYRGIYTDCLLEALQNPPGILLEARHDPQPGMLIITSNALGTYLEEQVPDALLEAGYSLNQEPQTIAESHPPLCFVEWGPIPTAVPIPIDSGSSYPVAPTPVGSIPSSTLHEARRAERELQVGREVDELLEAAGRPSFETRTGFSVVGTSIAEAFTIAGRADVFQESGDWHARIPEELFGSAVIRFADGSGTILPVAPGFVGTILVSEGRILNVNYLPAMHTTLFDSYMHVRDEVEERRALIAAMARQGRFDLKTEEALEIGNFLRNWKSLDLTLGIYAAYAYHQVGKTDSIQSVLKYMASAPPNQDTAGHRGFPPAPLPFDVALLAGELTKPRAEWPDYMAPLCPVIGRGWALLDILCSEIPPAIEQVRPHVVPSLWTTLDPAGVTILIDALEAKDIP